MRSWTSPSQRGGNAPVNDSNGGSSLVACAIGCALFVNCDAAVSCLPDQSPGSTYWMGWNANSVARPPGEAYPSGAAWLDTAVHANGASRSFPLVTACPDG